MNKQQFLDQLKKALGNLPQEDINQSLDYYSEMIDDRVEDGVSEEESVADIGNPTDMAKQILLEMPLTKLARRKMKTNRRLTAWEIALLIIGAPVWLPLLIAAFVVLVAVYVSIWSIVISLWACDVSFAACILGGIASSVIIFATGQNVYAAIVMIGAAFVCAGLSILFFFVCKLATKGAVLLGKKIIFWIKSCFIRKEEA